MAKNPKTVDENKTAAYNEGFRSGLEATNPYTDSPDREAWDRGRAAAAAGAAVQGGKPLPSLSKDDPRVARHIAEYEGRVAGDQEAEKTRYDQGVEARARYDEAKGKHAAAVEAARVAQEAVVVADAECAKWAADVAKYGDPVVPLTAAETLCPGEPTVLMYFPHAVTLQHNGRSATFPIGIQQVPTSLQAHPWLLSHGVRVYE